MRFMGPEAQPRLRPGLFRCLWYGRIVTETAEVHVADKEHLAILKQGAEAWNEWRRENPDVRSYLRNAYLRYAKLLNANLGGAYLRYTDLSHADLSHADLRDASLRRADLRYTDLSHADLRKVNLVEAILNRAQLRRVDFSCAAIGYTVISMIDLSEAVGIEEADHWAGSEVSTSTLELTAQGLASNPSRQGAVETFLRGASVAEQGIAYFRSLISKPIEFFSAFISYSHEDTDKRFAKRLYNDLQAEGIRCWLDEHEILPGDPIMKSIDRGIRIWDKILLCCSETSLESWWVQEEIEKTLDKERELKKQRGKGIYSLVPLNLDGYLYSAMSISQRSRRF
jgi:hypothetical protein